VTSEERRASLEAIAAEVRVCTRCRLAAGRTHAVPGEGHPDTEVVFVGEGPGQNEDLQGRPFVGAAGGLLTELIGSIGWTRDEVFITNVVKCRPPGNRDPEPDEITACSPYLKRQLEVLDPALVVTLGRFSLQTFMPGARIGQAHGTVRPVDPATGARNALTFAMYHPAAAFRQGSLKETMQIDACSIPEAVLRARAGRQAVDTPEPAAAATLIEVAPATEMNIPISVAQELVGALPEAQPDASEQGLWG
jgi:DNA polymerase